jgi:CBS domain-containing protein
MQVRDIMTQRVKTVRSTATAFEAAELMSLHDVGALPIFEGDALIGIVTDRDLILRCVAPGLDLMKTEVRQVMSRNPVAIDASAPVEEAARRFMDLRIRRMPVVDGQQVVGMLSSDDVARGWDDATAVLGMVRRLAPRRGRAATSAAG